LKERPCKFHNPWTIITPPGWSCLFVPPMNRLKPVFEVFSGIVDTDVYKAPVNVPFLPRAADGDYTLERGTPLVQVIPFKRGTIEGTVRPATSDEVTRREHIERSSQAGDWYGKARRHGLILPDLGERLGHARPQCGPS
jgi:hypothetical protein